MEIKKAVIKREDTRALLVLELSGQTVDIILTEDNPNNVKSVFNSILKELKKGNFKFDLEDEKEDLYYHICKEYLQQLNSEMNSTFLELQDLDLLENISSQQADEENTEATA